MSYIDKEKFRMHIILYPRNPLKVILTDKEKGKFTRILDEVPTADVVETPKWIPVTERLPEKDVYVLVSTEEHDIDIARYDYNEWVDDPVVEWWNGEYRVFPVAWMPLPEPYREETEDASET